jgi:hypothetical protein
MSSEEAMERSSRFRYAIADLLTEKAYYWEDAGEWSSSSDDWRTASALHHAAEIVRALDTDQLQISRFAGFASLLRREPIRYDAEPGAVLRGQVAEVAAEYFTRHPVERVSVTDVLRLLDEMFKAVMTHYAEMDLESFSPSLRHYIETHTQDVHPTTSP